MTRESPTRPLGRFHNPVWRITAFTIAVFVTSFIGRWGFHHDSGISLYWPATGVIVLWALTVRNKVEYFAFVALTFVVLFVLNFRTDFAAIEAGLLSLSNVAMGLLTRWTALLMVPVGRRFGLQSRNPTAANVTPATTVISRMLVPYDVFRLFGSAFVGASLAWGIVFPALVIDGDAPGFVDGAIWTVRNVASVLLIAGTGLAILERGHDRRRSSISDTVFALVATTGFAVVALLLSSFIPLASMVLIPLFWSAVRSKTSIAALHAVYTTAVLLAMVVGTRGAVFGLEYSTVAMSVRLHLLIILTFLISLVVATAVNEFVRLYADLVDIADTSERRASALRTVTETIPDALLTVDQNGRATPLNTSGTTFVRSDDRGGLQLVPWPGQRPPNNPDHIPSKRALAGETVAAEPFTFTDRSGATREFEVTAAPLLPEGSGYSERALLLIRDVSESVEFLRELKRLAERDPLTGLSNRRHFDEKLAEHIAGDATAGGVIILDMDGFKSINDTFGHAFGDQVLIGIADVLRDVTDDADVLTRLGGDEFAILVPDADREHLQTLANRLVEQIRAYARTLDGASRSLSASIGGVLIENAIAQGIPPLVAADRLMYGVKYTGRDNVVISGDGIVEGGRSRSAYEWKVRLEEALINDDLDLHFQPILDVESGRIVGAEALVRLIDDGHVVPPSEFVPVAERSGLIIAMDIWVVERALLTFARLRERIPDLTIWLNISAHSIGNVELEQTLVSGVAKHGIPPSAVVLELTETAQLTDVVSATAFATRLHEHGFRLAVDDFGSGFGPLLYLKFDFFEFIKIDGAFISRLDRSRIDRAIVHAVVGLAGELGRTVVAEHVESDSVLDAVRDERIHLAQGFGIGRPCPEDEFVEKFL